MELRDEVEVVEQIEVGDDGWGNPVYEWVVIDVLPAYVSYSTVAAIDGGLGRTALVEELRAIIRPYPYDPVSMRLRWNGVEYLADGPPMIRRRHGRDHHLTIPIRAVT